MGKKIPVYGREMTMKTLLAGVLTITCAIFYTPARGEGQEKKDIERKTYLYCNVYASVICFGISHGDELVMTIPADYVRYDMKLNGGINSTLYVGYNASIKTKSLALEFEKCTKADGVCSFVSNSDGFIEAVYSGGKQEATSHLLVSEVTKENKNSAIEFVLNFRACRSSPAGLACKGGSAFHIW